MSNMINILLNTTEEQTARLEALQKVFSEVCTTLALVVQESRCWNRVALHHMTYHSLREHFPQVGSQMICNAIYSVSRCCRVLFQNPASPFNIDRFPDRGLPRLHFTHYAPVYFDRHTLSFKNGQLSMYTLDGRMRFQLDIKPEDELRFNQEKLKEIVLSKTGRGYQLSFLFSTEDHYNDKNPEFPEYVMIHSTSDMHTALD